MSDKSKLIQLKRAKLLRLKQEAYRRDPMLWVEEVLGEDRKSFQWSLHEGYENHEWDGDIDPLYQAWQILADSYAQVQDGNVPSCRFTGIESATGVSKTYAAARIVFWFLDCFENSLVVTTAPKEGQLKLGLWSEIGMLQNKIKKVRPKSELYNLRLVMDDSDPTEDLDEAALANSWHAVGFVAGTSANEQSANKARGFHRKNMLIILEECTGISPSIITALQNTSTGLTNYIFAIGNPDNEFDPLHRFCMQPDVTNFRISANDYPNIVLQKEIYAGAVTQASINARAVNYGVNSPLYNAMVRGLSPEQAADSLIKKTWVDKCRNLKVDDGDSLNSCGVDVAQSKTGDEAAIAWGLGARLVYLESFPCPNATHLAYNLILSPSDLASRGMLNYNTRKIFSFIEPIIEIGVDSVGVGVATLNALDDEGYYPVSLQGGQWKEVIPCNERQHQGRRIEEPMYSFVSLRAQMYWEAREDLRLGNVSIELEDEEQYNRLAKELCIPKFSSAGSRIQVESKKDIKKRLGGESPNKADAFVYWNWTRKGYRTTFRGMAAIFGG